jgi:hypothetical protein
VAYGLAHPRFTKNQDCCIELLIVAFYWQILQLTFATLLTLPVKRRTVNLHGDACRHALDL